MMSITSNGSLAWHLSETTTSTSVSDRHVSRAKLHLHDANAPGRHVNAHPSSIGAALHTQRARCDRLDHIRLALLDIAESIAGVA